MSALLDAVLIGAGLSLVLGLAGLGLAGLFGAGDPRLWRFVRALALAPLPLALIILFLPAAPDAAPLHEPLGPVTQTQTVMPAYAGFPVETGPAAATPMQRIAAALPILRAAAPWLYLAGLALALGLAWRRHQARRALLQRTRPAGAGLRAELDHLARQIGVAAPEMRLSAEAGSPFLTGWTPVLVLPDRLEVRPAERRYALAHELTHARRGDERDRLVGAALTTLFWFHWPLRRIEARLGEARELACDADCIGALGGRRTRVLCARLDHHDEGRGRARHGFQPRRPETS